MKSGENQMKNIIQATAQRIVKHEQTILSAYGGISLLPQSYEAFVTKLEQKVNGDIKRHRKDYENMLETAYAMKNNSNSIKIFNQYCKSILILEHMLQ